MKKNLHLFLILIFILCGFVVLTSCEEVTTLETPQNFKIIDDTIQFDEVANAVKYRIEALNKEDGSTLKRFVEKGMAMADLNIPEGNYDIHLQACNADASIVSEYTDYVSYKQIDLDAVKSLSGLTLIDGNYIKWMGRTHYDDATASNYFNYSASGFSVKVKKIEDNFTCTATLTGTNVTNLSKQPYVVLVLDNDFENTITLAVNKSPMTINLVGENGFTINDENVHTVSLYKRSESIDSKLSLKSIETNGKFVAGVEYKTKKIEVIAASSSTGYGNLGNSSGTKTTANSDALHAFAFLAAQSLDAEINIVSASGWGIYASRWTSPNTINMRDRYKYFDVEGDTLWDTSSYVPDVIVTNFGTNDLSYINMFTGTEKEQKTQAFIDNYVGFLNDLHTIYPNAQIIILYGLMLESGIYTQTEQIYEQAKTTIPNLAILKVQGDAQGCASHPSISSHKQISEQLSSKIKELMNW